MEQAGVCDLGKVLVLSEPGSTFRDMCKGLGCWPWVCEMEMGRLGTVPGTQEALRGSVPSSLPSPLPRGFPRAIPSALQVPLHISLLCSLFPANPRARASVPPLSCPGSHGRAGPAQTLLPSSVPGQRYHGRLWCPEPGPRLWRSVSCAERKVGKGVSPHVLRPLSRDGHTHVGRGGD